MLASWEAAKKRKHKADCQLNRRHFTPFVSQRVLVPPAALLGETTAAAAAADGRGSKTSMAAAATVEDEGEPPAPALSCCGSCRRVWSPWAPAVNMLMHNILPSGGHLRVRT